MLDVTSGEVTTVVPITVTIHEENIRAIIAEYVERHLPKHVKLKSKHRFREIDVKLSLGNDGYCHDDIEMLVATIEFQATPAGLEEIAPGVKVEGLNVDGLGNIIVDQPQKN